jgi:16S rRNA U516 pseudouridylate synthase RsuA-like enzyme
MVRTQIQLTEKQARQLKRLAGARGQSMARLIRASVDQLLAASAAAGQHGPEALRRRATAVVGRFHARTADLGAQHDRYLARAFGP